jgi:hypothetical protein
MVIISLLPPFSSWILPFFDSTLLIILPALGFYLYLIRSFVQDITECKQTEKALFSIQSLQKFLF